jgi:DNA-binding IclR family transcriptional regulator
MKLTKTTHKTTFYNRSLERALQILHSFSPEKQTFNLTQLSEALNLSKATVLRLCSTLIKYDFLKYDKDFKLYSLGMKLFELGSIIFSSFSIRRTATPHLGRLQSKLGKTVFLGVLQDDELIYIDKREDSRNPIRFSSRIGTRRPPHFGMLGQLLMAYLPDTEVNRILRRHPLVRFTKNSITDRTKFHKRLRMIRSQGYVVDEEGALEGITGAAAPIRDYTGHIVAGIGVGFISSSADAKGIEQIVADTREAAWQISEELGWSGGGEPQLFDPKPME